MGKKKMDNLCITLQPFSPYIAKFHSLHINSIYFSERFNLLAKILKY